MRTGRLWKRCLIGVIPFLLFSLLFSTAHADWATVIAPEVSSDWGLSGVHIKSSASGWAVGTDYENRRGVLLRFEKDQWTSILPPEVSSDWGLQNVFFTATNQGWAVGTDYANQRGVILRFANEIWTVVTPPNVSLSWGLQDIYFRSGTDGWAVGVDSSDLRGVMLRHEKGIWTSVIPPKVSLDWGLYGVHLLSNKHGWAVGVDRNNGRGALLEFRKENENNKDEKPSWQGVTPPFLETEWELVDVDIISTNEGWAVGVDRTNHAGVLLHSEKKVWNVVAPPEVSSDWAFEKVDFTSTTRGWAVGVDNENRRGFIIQYDKGFLAVAGLPEVSEDWGLFGLNMVSSNDGWAVGRDFAAGRGVLLKYSDAASETISTPEVPIGPVLSIPGTEYTYSAKGASSNLGHEIQYIFYWGDGTDSGWLPPGTTSATKTWSSLGTFAIEVQARCATHPSEVSKLSPELTVLITDPPLPIGLQSPPEGTSFDSCSLYDLPAFAWDTGESFVDYEIEFSDVENFLSIPVRVKASSTATLMEEQAWERVLLIPGKNGGPVYWRVAGSRSDKTTVTSNTSSFFVNPPGTVENPTISDTSKSSLPTLSWENNCNIKFKVWFGSDSNFSKKTSKSYNLKNPLDNGGVFTEQLKSAEWNTIRNIVKDVSGAIIYWYVEAWDEANRKTQTSPPMFFVLTD